MLTQLILMAVVLIVLIFGIRIVRPTERGLIERLGKYKAFAEPGFHWIIPIVDRMIEMDVTEEMVDAESQEIITKDNLNATVDAQIYFRVKSDEESVKNAVYNVSNVYEQIVALARTTLRNIIGSKTLAEANSERNAINKELQGQLATETTGWGIDIVRAELKEINPPQDVQETMNQVVKAKNEKEAAVDFATAIETKADGERRARIKEAEGKARAIELVNKAAEESFTAKAQLLKKLETIQNTLAENTKIIIPTGTPLLNVLNDLLGEKE